ncbi:hypothetical protein [Palleronia pelagia]|uniref:hypothetical protein n=1 Tax=Palleronia pelagia TaxID=387096 RepID=UPI000B82879A|nr:hypothetical protein [Palleronia pelagia]
MKHLEPCYDRDGLRLWHRPGDGPYLFVVFSGVGTNHAAQVQPEFMRFFRETPQHSALFVADDSRSWLNAPGLIDLVGGRVEAIRAARPDILRVVTLGNSMGGFSAIAIAPLLGAQTAIAFTPQVSVHPEVVPGERRWRRFRSAITDWRVRTLDLAAAEETLHFVFHGAHPAERRHWEPVPLLPHVHHYIFPDHSHFLVRPMKEAGLLHPIVAHAAARRPRRVRQCVERMGGMKGLHFERREAMTRAASSREDTTDDQVRCRMGGPRGSQARLYGRAFPVS